MGTTCSKVTNDYCIANNQTCSSSQYCSDCTQDNDITNYSCRTDFRAQFVTQILPPVVAILGAILLLLLCFHKQIAVYWNQRVTQGTFLCGGVCLLLVFVALLGMGGIIANSCDDSTDIFSGGCMVVFIIFSLIPAIVCFISSSCCLCIAGLNYRKLPDEFTFGYANISQARTPAVIVQQPYGAAAMPILNSGQILIPIPQQQPQLYLQQAQPDATNDMHDGS